MSIKIYHNPHCSKSRKTLQLLNDQGVQPEVIEYLTTPPSEHELTIILKILKMHPRELMRKGESEYKDHHLDDPSLSKIQLITAMIQYPNLIERPIVITSDQQCVLGRPPENVLDIIN
jgi:arsenate reductase